jgi:hypothetical protein
MMYKAIISMLVLGSLITQFCIMIPLFPDKI